MSEYTAGTLVVDIFDAATKTLVWRGVAQDELKRKQPKREKQASRAIEKLLRDYDLHGTPLTPVNPRAAA